MNRQEQLTPHRQESLPRDTSLSAQVMARTQSEGRTVDLLQSITGNSEGVSLRLPRKPRKFAGFSEDCRFGRHEDSDALGVPFDS